MKKTVAFFLALILVVSACASLANQCNRDIGKPGKPKACKQHIEWKAAEWNVPIRKIHYYNNQYNVYSTCNYEYRTGIKHYQCDAGHVQDTKNLSGESQHVCGKKWDY